MMQGYIKHYIKRRLHNITEERYFGYDVDYNHNSMYNSRDGYIGEEEFFRDDNSLLVLINSCNSSFEYYPGNFLEDGSTEKELKENKENFELYYEYESEDGKVKRYGIYEPLPVYKTYIHIQEDQNNILYVLGKAESAS